MSRIIVSSFLPFDPFVGTPQGFVAFAEETNPDTVSGGFLFHDKRSARRIFEGNADAPSVGESCLPDITPALPPLELDALDAHAIAFSGHQAETDRHDPGYLIYCATGRIPRSILFPVCRPDALDVKRLVIAGLQRKSRRLEGSFALVSDPSDIPNVYGKFAYVRDDTRQIIRQRLPDLFGGPRRPTIYVTGLLAQHLAIGVDCWSYYQYRQQGLVP